MLVCPTAKGNPRKAFDLHFASALFLPLTLVPHAASVLSDTLTPLHFAAKEFSLMARLCKLTGKRPLVANNVSHANNKTKRKQLPNLQVKRVFVPELDRWVRLRLTPRALRTVTRKGLLDFLKEEGLSLKDVIH